MIVHGREIGGIQNLVRVRNSVCALERWATVNAFTRQLFAKLLNFTYDIRDRETPVRLRVENV